MTRLAAGPFIRERVGAFRPLRSIWAAKTAFNGFSLLIFILIFVFIWVRGTLPRARIDQVMNFAWKFMLPMAFACIIAAAVWHYEGRRLMGWFWSFGVLAAVYLALSRILETRKKFAPRTYRFAE